jgi:uncharacterized protein (TIGR02453 family)
MPTAKIRAEPDTLAPFAGFGPRALSFLQELAANQTREWFLANRHVYESDLRRPLGALVEALSFAFAAHDIPLTGDPFRSQFRLNRDVRFSKDKAPYKTNAGATLTRDGVKMSPGMVYIQVGGQEGSFAAVGFYGFDPPRLAAFRVALVRDPARWAAVEASLAESGLDFSMGDPLTRIPKGFEAEADTALAPALKRRHHVVSWPIPAERLLQGELVEDIVELVTAGLPLLRFGWSALERTAP